MSRTAEGMYPKYQSLNQAEEAVGGAGQSEEACVISADSCEHVCLPETALLS